MTAPLTPALDLPGMAALTVTLPFPARELTPNARVHWRKLAELREQAKSDGANCARLALEGAASPFGPSDNLQALVVFHAKPTLRRRDLDNAFSGTKAYLDGVCAVLGVDDSGIRRVVLQWGGEKLGGEVTLTLERA